MIDRHHQDRATNVAERKAGLDYWLSQRMIGEATYLRSLFILGYSEDEARAELFKLSLTSC